ADLKAVNLNLHQLLTAASLIEREVVVDRERPLVAGVIYNRLEQDMRLEMDATVQYLLDKQKERLLYKDLEVE
ncbi:endolytic transglycosylase MltG, partial [Enterobacter cloacae]